MLQTQAPEGVGTSATYDKTGLKLSTTDARGTVTTYSYDAVNRLLTRTLDPSGLQLTTSYQYDAKGQTIRVTDPAGIVTITEYDLNGRVTRQTVDPSNGAYIGLNLQTVYTHDADGTTLSVQGPDGKLTRYTYDGAGRRIKEQVDPLGLNLTRSYTYDAEGNVAKSIDGEGNATLFIYDKANRLAFTIDAMGGVQQSDYDAEGRLSSQTTYAAFVPVAAWNGIAPSLSTMQAALPTLGLATTQSRRYDRDGRLRFAVDATGAVVEYQYDATGNVVETRAYAQRIDLSKWNGSIDPPVAADDMHDQRSRNTYDALGRKTFSIDGTGAVVRQVFDASGNVTERFAYSTRVPVTTAATATALAAAVALVAEPTRDQHDTYVYDRAGRQLSHTNGVGNVTSQNYDKNGNLISRAYIKDQEAGTNLFTGSEFADGLGDTSNWIGDVEASKMEGFAGALRIGTDPSRLGYAGAYKLHQSLTRGATYTMSVIVEMEDGLAPTFGNENARDAANSFAFASLGRMADPLAYVVQHLGGKQYRVATTGVASRSTAYFGIVKFTSNDARPFRVTAYQLEQSEVAGSVTPTTATPVLIAAKTQSQVTRYAYDSAGRLVYTLSPLGQLEKNSYDEAGRITLITRYAKPISMAGLGAALTVAQLQALVTETPGQDQQQYSVYDKSGRLSATVDAMGAVVTFVRDGKGNITERTAWANPIDLATWTAGTTPTPRADTARDQRTRIFYDGMGREALTVDALGYAVQRQYDASGRLTYVVRYPVAVPATTTNTHKAQLDAAVQFASTSGQPLQITAYGYDAAGNRTSQTQALGQPEAATTQFVYDGIGRLTRTIDARGVELSQSDSAWALTQRLQLKYVNAAGGALKASDLSTAQRQALAALYTTTTDYDAAGHKLSATDALGGVTRSEYDANGHVVKITDPRGNAAFYYFDAAGRVTLSVDPEGYATATTYDTLGHTLSVKRYFNRVSGTYGIAQPPALPGANPSDALTRFEYDAAGRLTKTIDAESNAESYTYNTLGQRETLTNKLDGVTAYTYDQLGRVASETLPIKSRNAAGQSVAVVNHYAYDAFGNKTTTTEAAGLPEQRVTQFRYDALNREVEQRQAQVSIYVDGKGWSTIAPTRTKAYDASGNLIAVVDPNGGRTRSWFDASNRKVAEVSATGTLSAWSYDTAGNVMSQRVYGDALALPVGDAQPTPVNVANARLTTYQVDANNRVTRSTIAGVQSGDYDAKGHQYNMAVTSDVVKRSFYDANGNVVREQNGKDAATLVWYDKLGQKVLEVDAMGYGVRWERDANGAVLRQTRYLQGIELGSLSESTAMADVLAKFRPAAGDQITEYSYDRNARVLSESRLNVVYGSVAANGALSEASTSATQRTVYDAMGNKSAIIDAEGRRSDMRYDALGRLLGAQRPGAADFNRTLVRQATDYEYDGLGNVRREIRRGTDNAVESDDQIVRYGYDATGVRTSMTTAKDETISYGRDANGNTTAQMTDRMDADGVVSRDIVSIGYDAANREVRRFTGQRDAANMPVFNVANTITLGYNTFGELTSKRTGSGNAQGQAQEYYDYDKAGRLWRTNAQGGVNKAWMYDLAGNATLQLESQRVDLRAMTWEQIAGDGTHPNPDILITITSYDQDNRVVSVMQPKMDASRPNLRMVAAPINVDSGKFGGLDIDVAPALAEANSTWIAGPSDGSATGQVGALGMPVSGGIVRSIANWEVPGAKGGAGNISSTLKGVTDVVLGAGGGAWHAGIENLYGAVTWRVEVGMAVSYLGRITNWPVTVRPMYSQFPPVSMYFLTGLATNAALPIPLRVIATTASGQDIVVVNGNVRQPTWPNINRSLSGTFMRLTGGEARDTDTIQLYSRPRGSNGPFSQTLPYFKAGQGGSSLNGVSVDGAYLTRLDGQGPLDILLIVTQSDGTVVRRQSIQYDPASGQSSSSVAPAQPVFTSDNVAHFTGLRINGSAIRVLQRPQGSQGEYSQRTYLPNGATGRFDVQFDGGASDVIIEVLDTNRNVVVDRLKGTVNPGASYYDMRPLAASPSSVTFRDIPVDARTLQIDYEPLSPGGLRGSITIPRSAAGDIAQWVWDAANLIPDKRSLYSYRLHFVARDEDGFILTDATGEATIGAISKDGTKARLTGNVKHQVMTFDPGIPEGRAMKLRYREKGATAKDFTEVSATRVKANTAFKWDATANNLDPDKEYEFVYDVYNAAGAVIGNGEGYFRLNNGADNKDVRWAIPNLPGEDVINNSWVIQRRQTYDAFGNVTSEIDGNTNANELRYNTLGLLIDKIGPSVDVTLANGQVQTTRPTEHYSYDLNGQLVGKRDANGNQSTVELNAAGQAVAEWHPGAAAGSLVAVRKSYDVFGNLRTVTDENLRVTNNEYDFNNRLKKVWRPVNPADGTRAFDTYDYDVLGQRIAHANALTFRERTYYDTMGRVTRYVSPEGASVNYGYTYDNSIGSAGGVNTGGWVHTTTDANGRTQTLKKDLFGRTMWKQDLGGHQFTYGYNWSGLISSQTGTSGQNISYSYYDNGYLRKVIDLGVSTESTFEYDNNGNRIFEGFKSTAGNVAMVFQWSRVSYDAYNRVKKIDDARYVIDYEYDANGNRRRVKSTYLNIVDQKKDVQDYWYAYDGMNRFTTTMGQMANGQIWRGGSGDGATIEYDDAGQRRAATYANDGHREVYDYDGAGNMTTMVMDGVLRSRRTNDLAGRVTRYEEWFKDGTLSTRKDRTWNKDNQLTVELEHRLTEGTNGRKWSDTTTAYTLMKDGTLSKVDSLTNAFNNFNPSAQDPAAVITRMISNYAYEWWDNAKQSSITLDPASTGYDPRRPQPPGYSAFGYDANGHLKTATDRNATTPRSFSYWTNAEGQVLQRQELIGGKIGADGNVSGASKSRDHRYFYFDGKRVGNVGNDGVEREDYAQQLARNTAAQSPDDKYRKFTPTNSADFDENYQPINAGFPGPAPGSYTVREGDTLENIARSLWGDAQLWYLLAEANGLDGQPSAPLTPNTVLQVPNKVTNLHNTSSTFRPYDPGKAVGDTSPTLPDPLPAPRGKDGGCGGIGK
ncbi:LysM peptidoglycan-binding domain-containing protein, partial [Variovorax sp. CAN2819]|uniref:LysM peptidoglycan-binding domain-containing protein n=1 Tax=Variovorax sp. CAN15 TaxID=3046727 RepID=UPI002647F5A8